MIHIPSDEQNKIIESIKLGKNVIVDACAGSGKSTTILSCSYMFPHLRFMQLTFNKQLQTEVQQSIQEKELQNISVHTYHGLAVKYYSTDCYNDTGIRRILREKVNPQIEIPNFDVIVIDEVQDMTLLYFHLIWHFLTYYKKQVQIFILGDEKQALYGFKGADSRFLTLGDICWKKLPNLKNKEFVRHTLKMSYRITDPMCDFLNKVMLGYDRVQSCKPGLPVVYIRRSIYNKITGLITLFNMINTLIEYYSAKYDDFFILSKSVKSSSKIIRMLENILVEKNIPCYVPTSDNKDDLDSRVINNKIVFSTFHASKGRQRPYVIVLGFDDSHFSYFAKDKDSSICPNELYVACTRATKKLFLWENDSKYSCIIPFLKYNHNELRKSSFVSFNGIPSGKKSIKQEIEGQTPQKHHIHPTELIKFLSEKTLDIITPIVEKIYKTISGPEMSIDIPSVQETLSGHCEDVSDLNGIVIPLIFFDRLRSYYEPVLQNIVIQNMKDVPEDEHLFLKDAVLSMPTECKTIQEYLYMANLSSATQDFLYSRFKQLSYDDCNWIKESVLEESIQNLNFVLKKQCKKGWKSEQYIIHSNDDASHFNIDSILSKFCEASMVYRFTARVDLITQNSIWELKCTNQITMEHKLQLILYAWLHQNSSFKEEKKRYYLFNIKTREHLELRSNIKELTFIVTEIIKNKYCQHYEMSDEEFINQF